MELVTKIQRVNDNAKSVSQLTHALRQLEGVESVKVRTDEGAREFFEGVGNREDPLIEINGTITPKVYDLIKNQGYKVISPLEGRIIPSDTRVTYFLVSFCGLIFGMIILGMNITGNVIGNLSGTQMNLAGIVLVVLSIIGLLIHFIWK